MSSALLFQVEGCIDKEGTYAYQEEPTRCLCSHEISDRGINCHCISFCYAAHRQYCLCQKILSLLSLARPMIQNKDLLETWGIEALSIRQSAGGSMLDFRYRVLDKDKAAPLFSRKVNPYLMDQKSGAVFGVPSSPKVGALRQTRPPQARKNYFIIFANPGGRFVKGDAVTIVIGELKIKDLIVE